ncbi:hypothetical protein GGX14DRAFT_629030 [Mycena pura]|uniref:Uncharacterized protein n=1 Tax=Mycena pura TaxID=153505 RepID=A0AAD7E3X8_9AGAR|nr:hypothetical protein GGX14DRAFT_629030 [Mycena pura]
MVVFDVVLFLGVLSLVIPLAPAIFSASVNRMKTWFALLISTAIYCISFLLLLGQHTGPEPPLPICTLQAGLIYAGPPLLACAGLLFVVELYMRLSAIVMSRKVNENFIYWMLWILPIVHTVDFWVAIMHGLADIHTISRDPSGLYCHITQKVPTTFTGVLTGIFVALMFVVESVTIVLMLRDGCLIVSCEYSLIDILVNTNDSSDDSTTSYVTLTFLAVPNICGSVPLSVSIVFGAQMDIVKWYTFWRKETPWVHPNERSAKA